MQQTLIVMHYPCFACHWGPILACHWGPICKEISFRHMMQKRSQLQSTYEFTPLVYGIKVVSLEVIKW